MLDAELVAVDRANGNSLRSFQELSTRARGDITAQQARASVLLMSSGHQVDHCSARTAVAPRRCSCRCPCLLLTCWHGKVAGVLSSKHSKIRPVLHLRTALWPVSEMQVPLCLFVF